MHNGIVYVTNPCSMSKDSRHSEFSQKYSKTGSIKPSLEISLWVGYLGLVIALVAQFLANDIGASALDWAQFALFVIILTIAFIEIRQRWVIQVKLGQTEERTHTLEYIFDQDKNTLRKIYDQSPNMHNIFHCLRDGYVDVKENDYDLELIVAKTRETILHVLDNITNILKSTTNIECAACIKLFGPKKNGEFGPLITLSRDTSSAQVRNDKDGIKTYDIYNNTAFHKIIQTDDRYFYSSDLSTLGELYDNERTDWKEHYLCTAVVPIRGSLPTQAGSTLLDYVGFLCIDTKTANGIEEKPTVYLLACVADSLYLILQKYREAHADEKEKSETS